MLARSCYVCCNCYTSNLSGHELSHRSEIALIRAKQTAYYDLLMERRCEMQRLTGIDCPFGASARLLNLHHSQCRMTSETQNLIWHKQDGKTDRASGLLLSSLEYFRDVYLARADLFALCEICHRSQHPENMVTRD